MELTLVLQYALLCIVSGLIVAELVVFVFSLRKLKMKHPVNFPKISVLLCVRNEEETIIECVKSLQCQEYPDFEILISEDHSNDNTPKILNTLTAENTRLFKFDVKKKDATLNPKSRQLERLMEYVSGQYVVIADGDTIYQPNWLSELHQYANEKYDLVSAVTGVRGNRFQHIEWLTSLARIASLQGKNSVAALGNNLLIKTQSLMAVGGFSSVKDTPTEDMKINALLKQGGFRTLFIPRKLAETMASPLKNLPDQRKRWLAGLEFVPIGIKIALYFQILFPVWVLLIALINFDLAWKIWLVFTVVRTAVDIKYMLDFHQKIDLRWQLIFELYRQFFTLYILARHLVSRKYIWKDRKFKM